MALEPTPPAQRGQAFTGRFEAATQRVLPAGEVVHLHLLRHGEVERLTERVLWGQEDVPLSDEGRRQSAALEDWWFANHAAPERVVTSDLVRCRVLAERIAARAKVELELEPALREQHLGAWQGRTWDDVTAADPEGVRAYWNDYVGTRPPDGESFGDLAERVDRWWSRLELDNAHRRIVVVTHVGVLRVLIAKGLGMPLDQALRLAPATGSHTALTLSTAGGVLESFGERPWLSTR